jgi:hypothetical protein
MFDTPDLRPVCLAPFVAIFIGFIVYGLSLIINWVIEYKTAKAVSWLKPFSLIVTIFIVPTACVASVFLNIGALDPLPWFTPASENVIGEWQLATSTANALEEWENCPVEQHRLVFKDDGTFIVNNVPNFWDDFRAINDDQKYITGSGTWRIIQPHEQYVVIAKFRTLNLQQHIDSEVLFYFEKHLPPYQLVIRWFEGKENSLMFRFDKQ